MFREQATWTFFASQFHYTEFFDLMDHLLVELKSIEEGSGGSLVGEVHMQAGGHIFWIPSTYIKKKKKNRC